MSTYRSDDRPPLSSSSSAVMGATMSEKATAIVMSRARGRNHERDTRLLHELDPGGGAEGAHGTGRQMSRIRNCPGPLCTAHDSRSAGPCDADPGRWCPVAPRKSE